MGNACCGGASAVSLQSEPTRLGMPIGTIDKQFEFTDIAQTAVPLQDLETAIESLRGEIIQTEAKLKETTDAFARDMTKLEQDLEGLKTFVPLSDPMNPVDYNADQITYCKERTEDFGLWRQQVEDQSTNVSDACDRARFCADLDLYPRFHLLKGMIAGFQKRMLKWKVKIQPNTEIASHVNLLEQKFANLTEQVSELEKKVQVLKEVNVNSQLVKRAKAFLDAVFWYEAVAEREVNDYQEDVVEESGQYFGVEEKEVASATIDLDEPAPRSVSLDAETPISLQARPSLGQFEGSSPDKVGVTFPPLVLEPAGDLMEIPELYSEAQELRATQESSLLRKFTLTCGQLDSEAVSREEVLTLFLDILKKKGEHDRELIEAGDMPLSLDVFVFKYFSDKQGVDAQSALLGFLKSLWTAKTPESQVISAVLNVFTGRPFPLALVQLLPGLLQSLSTHVNRVSLFGLLDKLFHILDPAEAMSILRHFKPESLTEGDYLVFFCCYRMHDLKKDGLYRMIAGESNTVTSEAVISGVINELNLPLTPSEQQALLSSANPAGGSSFTRMIFNKAFNAKQILDPANLAAMTLPVLLFIEKLMEVGNMRRNATIANLGERYEKAGRNLKEVVRGLEGAEQAVNIVSGKTFIEGVKLLEAFHIGPFRKAYFGAESLLGLNPSSEVPNYVTEMSSLGSP